MTGSTRRHSGGPREPYGKSKCQSLFIVLSRPAAPWDTAIPGVLAAALRGRVDALFAMVARWTPGRTISVLARSISSGRR